MVRVGGMSYACDPGATIGARISDMTLRRQADRRRQDLQGRGLGAGRGRRERRARMGSCCALSAREEGGARSETESPALTAFAAIRVWPRRRRWILDHLARCAVQNDGTC